MGKLSPHTINCYKWRLKKLRKVLPFIPEGDPERERALREIEKLTNQLGKEMSDLEIALTRGPGRPRSVTNLAAYEPAAVAVAEKEETQEERDARLATKQMERREFLLKNDPEFAKQQAEIQRSNDELAQMLKEGNDERPKQDADDAKAVGGTTRSV